MSELMVKIYENALQKLAPNRLVEGWMDAHYDNVQSQNYAFSVGKAAIPMMQGLQNKLGSQLQKGLLISPKKCQLSAHIKTIKSSHPLPDEQSMIAAGTLFSFVQEVPRHSTLFALISGGTSSFIEKPAGSLSLEDIRCVFELLIESGAAIEEINSVRKHLSTVKGGQLLRHISSKTLINLAISDVPGDDLATIGSGPTTWDSTTFADAIQVLKKYKLWENIPEPPRDYLESGRRGQQPETLKPGDPISTKVTSEIIGSARQLAEEVGNQLSQHGYCIQIGKKAFQGSVSKVANTIGNSVKKVAQSTIRPKALIYFGESTVQVTGLGKGGRNQELALHAVKAISGLKDVQWLSIATDGVDGPTDAAGALVDGFTLQKAEKKGLDIQKCLAENNSYRFHEQMNTLIKTGSTSHNLMDLQIVLIHPH